MSGNTQSQSAQAGTGSNFVTDRVKQIAMSSVYSGLAGAALAYLIDGNASEASLFGMTLGSAAAVGVGTAVGTAISEVILEQEAVRSNKYAMQLGQALKPAASAITVPLAMVTIGFNDISDTSALLQYAAIGAVSSYAGTAVSYLQNNMGATPSV